MARVVAWVVGIAVVVLVAAAAFRSGGRALEPDAEASTIVRPVRGLSLEQWRRQVLFDLLQPVKLSNCVLERFGEAYDGGYLLCSNLLKDARSAYSYGISGYDKWGCDVATRYSIPVHQYDCFNLTRPVCATGKTIFHEECVGGTRTMIEGRLFDTIAGQFERNGDTGKNIVMKMDVEGSEWDTFMTAPEAVFDKVDQLAIEFHWAENETFDWVHDERYLRVVTRLREHFEVAHLHFNNTSCIDDLQPFPSHAFEVLFVSRRIAIVAPDRRASIPHPLDAPNNPSFAECVVEPADRVR